jgi:ADP-heptose:LPS heptosyltransferase
VAFEGDLALRWKRTHVADSLVALVEAASAQCEDDRRLIHAPPATTPGARRARPVVCVHTGAGSRNKQWPAESFAGLIDLLAGEAGAAIVIIGGPDEAAFANTVIRRARRRAAVENRVGRTPLAELPALLATVDLYVGNDSGPKHIAAALGVATIGIHSGSVDAGEWGAVGPRALTIRRDMSCSPCYLARIEDCHRGLACLDGIRVGDVFEACRRMLALSGAAASRKA